LAGGTPIILECNEKQGFKINPSELEKSITKKTKWIILNSPSNPTGACYSEEDIKEIAKVLIKHPHVNILSDDIYEHVAYEGFKFFTIAQINELKERVLTMNGVSKAYSMTGWRIGYAAGPKEIIKAISKIQSQSTSNPSSISQAAAVEALNGTQDFIKERAISFQERRDFVVKALNKIKGINCLNPDGAFYVFPSCKGLLGKKDTNGNELKTDTDFVQSLLENNGVAVVQGSAFGLEGFFRISYATSMKNLEKALEKISIFCKSLN
jgi:aspartate aminotransferase